MNQIQSNNDANADTRPWWKHGYLWLVIGGPLAVVIASFVTLFFVLETPDPVYQDAPGGQVLAPAEDAADAPQSGPLMPAMQARNHAATSGAAPKPDETPKP
ncbi:MAG: nitrogen fixation protein FixH [Burkholderiaceae bacterium]|jgi:hypothetical protein|nr:nitrogen fixation protein FixH [Burkholderiaceae bacterium]